MVTVAQLQLVFLRLIRVGVAMRLSYCFLKMIQDDEEVGLYKKRIRNLLVFYILAESIWQLKNMAMSYFG